MSSQSTLQKKRKTSAIDMSSFLLKYSPLKSGAVIVKDEDKPLTKYNKIANRLYLGNFQAAGDKDFFKGKNIKAVLNCTKDLPLHFCERPEIEYMRLPLNDSLKQIDIDKMYDLLPAAICFIYKHVVQQKQNILIHCYAGRQRSAIVVAAYLVVTEKMTPHLACKHVLEKRPESFHFGTSLNFEDSLKRFEKSTSSDLRMILKDRHMKKKN
jgi:protein-tyrosine phosphatase